MAGGIPRSGTGGLSSGRAAERVAADLAELLRAVHRESEGAGAEPPAEVPLRIELTIPLGAGSRAGTAPILVAARDAIARLTAVPDLFREGIVHCFRCGSSECGHGVPPRPAAVFAGFAPTGQPEWADFASELVSLRDERVSLLYESRPQLVVLPRAGRDLKERLLGAFGRSSKGWDLLGQLSVGYLRTPAGPLALTLQAVESRGSDGRVRVSLSALAAPPDGRRASEWLETHGDRRLWEAVLAARRAFRALEEEHSRLGRPGAGRGDSKILGRVPRILAELRRDLEQRDRQGVRRTAHAEERRRDSRPTPAAQRDVREAADDAFHEDERRGTMVVLGPRGRAHVFSPDGRHVTSLVIAGDQLTRRIERERWRPATKARAEELRRAVAAGQDANADGPGFSPSSGPRSG